MIRTRPPRNNIYLVYDSNLNIDQMAFRCPSAKPIGTGVLPDCRLAFRGRRKRGVLTIEPWDGKHVPVAAWEVASQNELSLDEYGGFLDLYCKETITLPITSLDDRKEHMMNAFMYVMQEWRPLGFPTGDYEETVRQGYQDFGFDQRLIDEVITYIKRLQ